jgi:hypothetical protein
MSDKYSCNGAYPQELLDYWKFDDGTVRTDLNDLSSSELEQLGWFGPIDMPTDSEYYTHSFEWNSETLSFDATELSIEQRVSRVNYDLFWNLLLAGVKVSDELTTDGIAYKKIKSSASQSLEVNTAVTEFIMLISEAKNGRANRLKIQEVLGEVFQNIIFTSAELAEIQAIFAISGMGAVYTLQ